MFKLRKAICLVLIGIFILGINSITGEAKGTDAAIKDIKIIVKDCNIVMCATSKTKITYDYNSQIFDVKEEVNKSTLEITIKVKQNAKTGLKDRVKMYIPVKTYNKISIESDSAGVTLPKLNVNFDIVCEDGAISFDVPAGFNKTFQYELIDSAGTIDFAKNMKNYSVDMVTKNSAVSVPATFPAYKYNAKQSNYVNGKGTAKFNIKVENSAFTFAIKK